MFSLAICKACFIYYFVCAIVSPSHCIWLHSLMLHTVFSPGSYTCQVNGFMYIHTPFVFPIKDISIGPHVFSPFLSCNAQLPRLIIGSYTHMSRLLKYCTIYCFSSHDEHFLFHLKTVLCCLYLFSAVNYLFLC
jgi:hypothetical protein